MSQSIDGETLRHVLYLAPTIRTVETFKKRKHINRLYNSIEAKVSRKAIWKALSPKNYLSYHKKYCFLRFSWHIIPRGTQRALMENLFAVHVSRNDVSTLVSANKSNTEKLFWPGLVYSLQITEHFDGLLIK